MNYSFLQDFHGNFSSKRKYGSLALKVGTALIVFLVILCCFITPKVPFEELISPVIWLIGFGAALLGWGVFEDKKIVINKK
jgi:uncharacterized protein YqhQ